MGKLIENRDMRDKIYVFEDRHDAGKLLSEMLMLYKGTDSFILAIPSGGVPVASEIAKKLDIPIDLLIVRKIQLPDNPEAGFGAAGPGGDVIFNESLLRQLFLTDKEIAVQVEKARESIRVRNEIFRKNRLYPSFKDRNVIIVDDGLASGYTMLAAIAFVKKEKPRKIIVAVPTALERTIRFTLLEVDELICLNVRTGYSFAVADAYRNWYDLTDEEVTAFTPLLH